MHLVERTTFHPDLGSVRTTSGGKDCGYVEARHNPSGRFPSSTLGIPTLDKFLG